MMVSDITLLRIPPLYLSSNGHNVTIQKPTSNMELHWNVIIFNTHTHMFNNKIKYNCFFVFFYKINRAEEKRHIK